MLVPVQPEPFVPFAPATLLEDPKDLPQWVLHSSASVQYTVPASSASVSSIPPWTGSHSVSVAVQKHSERAVAAAAASAWHSAVVVGTAEAAEPEPAVDVVFVRVLGLAAVAAVRWMVQVCCVTLSSEKSRIMCGCWWTKRRTMYPDDGGDESVAAFHR